MTSAQACIGIGLPRIVHVSVTGGYRNILLSTGFPLLCHEGNTRKSDCQRDQLDGSHFKNPPCPCKSHYDAASDRKARSGGSGMVVSRSTYTQQKPHGKRLIWAFSLDWKH